MESNDFSLDMKPAFLSPTFSGRPIILSPAPVEQNSIAYQSGLPNYQAQRQQSVGYNLQQEFETLKADLDLDLSHSNDGVIEENENSSSNSSNGNNANPRVLSGGPSLLSPTSMYSQNMAPSLSENLRERAISPSVNSVLISSKSSFLPLAQQVPSRPQSVNDFGSLLNRLQFLRLHSNFYPEMVAYTTWMENLNPPDVVTMLDHWCSSLPFDILLTMKSKLEAHLHHAQAPVFNKGYYHDFDLDSLSLDESRQGINSGLSMQPQGVSPLVQPKPKTNLRSHLFADMKVQRPKLADPSLHNRFPSQLDRARSPTSHLYEKTNFLQLAAGTAYGGSSDEGLDLSAASKLGALATINSRLAVDSSRKNHAQARGGRSALAYEETLNRAGNSSSVPATTQKYSMAAMAGPVKKKEPESPKGGSPTSGCASSMPPDIASPELLGNIPAWLKLLRLHKYTDCLKDIYWKDLIDMSDQQLEDVGVKALGARRKLLKAFEAVKQVA